MGPTGLPRNMVRRVPTHCTSLEELPAEGCLGSIKCNCRAMEASVFSKSSSLSLIHSDSDKSMQMPSLVQGTCLVTPLTECVPERPSDT